jgi:selenocysteine lyase/cysteine desulfurase
VLFTHLMPAEHVFYTDGAPDNPELAIDCDLDDPSRWLTPQGRLVRRGDKILVFDGEFPRNVTPWRSAADLFGLTREFVPI